MKGIALETLVQPLHFVPTEHIRRPIFTIQNVYEKLAHSGFRGEDYWGPNEFDFYQDYHSLPLRAFRGFSFDELCKLKFSSTTMMHDSVDNLFQSGAEYEVVRKISSSLWRWSVFSDDWNQIVAAYEGLRQFELGLDSDFELRLDFTTGYNERGYSKFTRTFLDGVFAFLLYYQGEHVMTISFVVTKGYQLLVTQVQLTKRKGNLFLFKFPTNRLEFFLRRFSKAFPTHQIGVVDGDSLCDQIMGEYSKTLHSTSERLLQYEEEAKRAEDKSDRQRYQDSVGLYREECDEFKKRITHLMSDRARIVSFYQSIGRFSIKKQVEARGLQFHLVV